MTGKIIPRIFLPGLALILASFAGCSNDPTSNSNDAAVAVESEMSEASVTPTAAVMKGAEILGGGALADSLKISRIRILVSALKLHRDKEDEILGAKSIKAGPFVLQVDANGTTVLANAFVTPGAYDKVKVEFHRLSESEVPSYLNDPIFADFVTNERSTVIIDGNVYVDGIAHPFTYKSDMTANLEYKFDAPPDLVAGVTTRIVLRFSPIIMFRGVSLVAVLDPRDPANRNVIDDAIKRAIKCWKR